MKGKIRKRKPASNKFEFKKSRIENPDPTSLDALLFRGYRPITVKELVNLLLPDLASHSIFLKKASFTLPFQNDPFFFSEERTYLKLPEIKHISAGRFLTDDGQPHEFLRLICDGSKYFDLESPIFIKQKSGRKIIILCQYSQNRKLSMHTIQEKRGFTHHIF